MLQVGEDQYVDIHITSHTSHSFKWYSWCGLNKSWAANYASPAKELNLIHLIELNLIHLRDAAYKYGICIVSMFQSQPLVVPNS